MARQQRLGGGHLIDLEKRQGLQDVLGGRLGLLRKPRKESKCTLGLDVEYGRGCRQQ